VATIDGIAGEMVCGLMVAAVEARFGRELPIQPIEWLTNNGSPYHEEVWAFAQDNVATP